MFSDWTCYKGRYTVVNERCSLIGRVIEGSYTVVNERCSLIGRVLKAVIL